MYNIYIIYINESRKRCRKADKKKKDMKKSLSISEKTVMKFFLNCIFKLDKFTI